MAVECLEGVPLANLHKVHGPEVRNPEAPQTTPWAVAPAEISLLLLLLNVMMMTGPDLPAHPTNTGPWTLGLCPMAHSLPPCSPENGFYTFALAPIALVLACLIGRAQAPCLSPAAGRLGK